MNRTQFGKIIKSLRKEHIDLASGSAWTQQRLAMATNLSVKVISNIERGERKKIEKSELVQLANGLKLTTLERREFFLYALDIGIEDLYADFAHPNSDIGFEHAWKVLKTTQCPAYLFDPLFNLIGINHSMMALRGATNQLLDSAIRSELGANVIGLVLRQDSVLRRSMGSKWEAIVRSNLQQFRLTSLRYRHLDRYERTMSLLHQKAEFSRLWNQTRTAPATDLFSQLRQYDYTQPNYGPISYTSTMSSTVTNYGNIYLLTHVPSDKNTSAVFANLNQSNQGARTLMPWPDLLFD